MVSPAAFTITMLTVYSVSATTPGIVAEVPLVQPERGPITTGEGVPPPTGTARIR